MIKSIIFDFMLFAVTLVFGFLTFKGGETLSAMIYMFASGMFFCYAENDVIRMIEKKKNKEDK